MRLHFTYRPLRGAVAIAKRWRAGGSLNEDSIANSTTATPTRRAHAARVDLPARGR